jgi:hypothetical protein
MGKIRKCRLLKAACGQLELNVDAKTEIGAGSGDHDHRKQAFGAVLLLSKSILQHPSCKGSG